MQKYKNYLIIISIFILDLISKLLVTSNLKLYGSKVVIKDFFNITYTKNTGAAFSILENSKLIIILVSFAMLFYLLYEIRKKDNSKIIDISLSLIIGGLIGNLEGNCKFQNVIIKNSKIIYIS